MTSKVTNDSLCRICLDEGAILAIFDSNGAENSIYNKINNYVKVKVEDVYGYPRFICEKCNNTLEIVCKFIDTFTESSKIIEAGLLNSIKHELITQYEDNNDFDYSDVEIKQEINLNNAEPDSKLVEPLVLKIKNDTCVVKKPKNNRNEKSAPDKNKTNRIGSCMLEGEYIWNGESWSLNTNKVPPLRVKRFSSKHTTKPQNKAPKKVKEKINLPKPKSEFSKLCDVCGEVFENPNKLTNHKRKKHLRQPIQCPKCPRKCLSQYYLNRHVKRKHGGSKDFICSVCGAQFVFKSELSSHNKSVHEKTIKPKKRFTCKICEKNFACKRSLITHERSVHTGERPAVCTECQATFYHEDYLKEHMRLHTGEKPFKCPICGRGYAQSGNMKSHLRNHRSTDIDPDVLSKLRPSYLKYLKDFR